MYFLQLRDIKKTVMAIANYLFDNGIINACDNNVSVNIYTLEFLLNNSMSQKIPTKIIIIICKLYYV